MGDISPNPSPTPPRGGHAEPNFFNASVGQLHALTEWIERRADGVAPWVARVHLNGAVATTGGTGGDWGKWWRSLVSSGFSKSPIVRVIPFISGL